MNNSRRATVMPTTSLVGIPLMVAVMGLVSIPSKAQEITSGPAPAIGEAIQGFGSFLRIADKLVPPDHHETVLVQKAGGNISAMKRAAKAQVKPVFIPTEYRPLTIRVPLHPNKIPVQATANAAPVPSN